MSNIVQLHPQFRMETPLGPGWAVFFTDYGPGSDQVWTIALDTGAVVAFPNWKVRMANDYSAGRWNDGIRAALKEKGDPGDAVMRENCAAPKPRSASGGQD